MRRLCTMLGLALLMTSCDNLNSFGRPNLEGKLGQHEWLVPSKYNTCAASGVAAGEIWIFVSQVLPIVAANNCYSSQKALYKIAWFNLGMPPAEIATKKIKVIRNDFSDQNIRQVVAFKSLPPNVPFNAMEMGMGYVYYPGYIYEIYQNNDPTNVFYKCISVPNICSIFFQNYSVMVNVQWGESKPPRPYYILKIANSVNLAISAWRQ